LQTEDCCGEWVFLWWMGKKKRVWK